MFYIAYKKEKINKGEKVNIKIIEDVDKSYMINKGYEIIEIQKNKKINIEILSSWLHTEVIEL